MTRQSAGPESAVAEQLAPRRTILVVDDEDALLRMLALLLQDEGYRVLTAHDGRAALEATDAERVDVVITDFMLPHMDGGELLRALHAAHPRTPVMVMSSLEERSIGRVCNGHAGFFRKPFDVPDFLRAVSALASGQRDQLRLVQ
jgi:DNA-binding response OmpR family regulator